MGNRFGYTINGPQPEATDLPIRLSTSPNAWRESKLGGNNLRNLYQHPVTVVDHRNSISSLENGRLVPETPNLPLTPPSVEEDFNGMLDEATSVTETARARSMLTTPVHRVSPPTPDNTPPRERPQLHTFLGTQPSMASTRADSFRTAHEEFSTDKESVVSLPLTPADRNRSSPYLTPYLANGIYRPSPLANVPITNLDLTPKQSSPLIPSAAETTPLPGTNDRITSPTGEDHSPVLVQIEASGINVSSGQDLPVTYGGDGVKSPHVIRSRKEGVYRGRSLRDRLEDSQHRSHSPSMDKFASIIGWSNDVLGSVDDSRRWSGTSNTSTVEAFLIESPRLQKKRNTLRHVSKNDSLRSTSSPLPNSNRTSMQSSSDSPHRLIHKKAKLSNHNRFSFGSEISRNMSLELEAAPKVEVIRVAIIPERSSSLTRSAVNGRRQSHSTIGAPTSFRMPRSSDSSQRQRALTDTSDRSRERHYPPQVPARGSSLSAPTSRNTSRANSLSSDHTRFERKRAEKDLRNTLSRMESERLPSSVKSESADTVGQSARAEDVLPTAKSSNTSNDEYPDIRAQDFAASTDPYLTHVLPNSREWNEFRPNPTLYTPFSQPSFMSASPEISEAKMISLHVHNNRSVQLIEPFPLAESQAVEEARKLHRLDFQDDQTLDSPLRNPRDPPPTPQFHIIPATPQDEIHIQLGHDVQSNLRPSTPRRPVARTRTDSFAKNLLRTVSLKNTRNKKADQDLDSTLNPFWRPRPFWDGIEPISPEKQREVESGQRGIVNNSLGLPQQRTVIPGPLGLVRKLSERRRQNKFLAKQSSYSSLQRLRTGRKMYRLPGLGIPLHFMSLQSIQERVHISRQRKEDDKREKRREALRKSIGPNVVATGDSRFPANMDGEDNHTGEAV